MHWVTNIPGLFDNRNRCSMFNLYLSFVLFLFIVASVDCDHDDRNHIPRNELKVSRITIEYLDELDELKSKVFEGHYFVNSGYSSPDHEVKGQMVYVETVAGKGEAKHEGCGPLNKSLIPTSPWVALIAQGNCTFNEKVYYAAKASTASAVIIYMNENSKENLNIALTTVTSDEKKNYDGE